MIIALNTHPPNRLLCASIRKSGKILIFPDLDVLPPIIRDLLYEGEIVAGEVGGVNILQDD